MVMGGPPPVLYEGYRRFLQRRLPDQRHRFERLSSGQSPKVALVGCVDSRCNPTTVFDARPGDLLIVRNIANLVPPYRLEGGRCCTSAALEFAISQLGVEHLVVKGHSGCGGIKACIEAVAEAAPDTEFVGSWIDLAREALGQIHAEPSTPDGDALVEAVGQRSVMISLERLRVYPFIAQALAQGRLQLHGAWFDIGDASLSWLDRAAGAFRPVVV
ncbi:MAG: carbonic anhydrase [Geminicoccaceae bacterium]|nr:MAG: carbonic anhydrase [Geminicoccaceae bacterium]